MPDRQHRPVIVGVGQVTQHVEAAAEGREPLDLVAEALRNAAKDTGVQNRVLDDLDSLDVVNVISWQYDDLPGRLAHAVGASPARAAHSDWGGDRPTLLLDRAAARIARGDSRIAAVVGGEAIRTLELGLRGGQMPAWTPPPAGAAPPNPMDHVPPLAWDHGLRMPTEVYPLYENALRAATGRTHADNQDWSGRLWEKQSRVAVKNPGAWDPNLHTADEIVTPSTRNRMVSHPYTKLMTARIAVNQAAAAIVMDAATADELGIHEGHRVSPLGGAGLSDPDDILARVAYDHAPAMALSLEHALARAGLTIDDCDLLELYSCFPCVPKLAIGTLGLPDDVEPSVTGGLTFFGGPGNDYMLHAVVAMVRAMRDGAGRTGLLYGNGGFVTKHHTLLLRAGSDDTPYPATAAELDARLQEQLDARSAPPTVPDATGPATIETWTVPYGPNGSPEQGIVVCRTADGARSVALTDDVASLIEGEPIGMTGTLRRGDGHNLFDLD